MQTTANYRQEATTGKRQIGRKPTGEMLRLRECRIDLLIEERRILLQSLILKQPDKLTCAALMACHFVSQR